jgi:hypothetical protein
MNIYRKRFLAAAIIGASISAFGVYLTILNPWGIYSDIGVRIPAFPFFGPALIIIGIVILWKCFPAFINSKD